MPDPTMILAILIVVVGCIAVTLVNLYWRVGQLPEWKQNERVAWLETQHRAICHKLDGDFEATSNLFVEHAVRIDELCNCQTATACRVRALEMGRRGLVAMCEPVREGRPS